MVELKGIIPPIVTPMHENESINEEELRRQVSRLIDAGVHGIFCVGTIGESYALSYEEKQRIFSITIEESAGRVPVYAGTGCITTRETVALSKSAEELGADVVSVITPSFAPASQAEVEEHYRAVAAAVRIPILLYSIPARTGIAIAPPTVARLAGVENILGIKDSSGNFDNILELIKVSPKGFSVLSGNDSLILWNLLAGGSGSVAGTANVLPKTLVALYDAFAAGDIKRAAEIQDMVRELRGCFKHGNPSAVIKEMLLARGFPVGKARKPFDRISPEGKEAIRSTLLRAKETGLE